MSTLTLDEAQRLYDEALDAVVRNWTPLLDTPRCLADRERLASDLAGLREHRRVTSEQGLAGLWCDGHSSFTPDSACHDARRYADGLRRTAALYGVTP